MKKLIRELWLDKSNWLGIVFLLMGTIPWNPGRFIHAQYIGLMGGALLVAWCMRKYFDWSVCVAFLYLMFNGLTYLSYPRYFFGILAPTGETLLGGILGGAMIWLLVALLLSIFAIIKKDGVTHFEKAMHYIFWGQLLFLLTSKFIFTDFTGLGYEETHGRLLGMVDNEAMDGTLLLLLYPLVLLKNNSSYWKHVLVTAVMLASGSSTVYFGLALMWILYFGIKYFMRKEMFIGLGVAAGAVLIGYMTVGGNELISTSGRYGVWKAAFGPWIKDANYLIGTGIGSLFLYLPGIQLQGSGPGVVRQVWVWMHNSWLQVLFELGIIGLVSVILLYSRMIWKSLKSIHLNNGWLFISVVLYGATNFVQMHERHEILTIVGIFFLVKTLGKRGYVWTH